MIHPRVQKYVFLIFVLLLSTGYGALYCQSLKDNIDSLKQTLTQTTDLRKRVDIYNDLAYSYRRASLDSLKLYADSALVNAQQLDYKKGLLWAYKNQGIYRYKAGSHPDSILQVIELAIKYAIETEDYYNHAALNNNIGLVKASEDKHRESVQCYLLGLEILHDHQYPPSFLEGLMNGNLSVSYRRLNQNERAYKYALNVNNVSAQLGDPSLKSIFSSTHGAILFNLGKVEASKQYLEEAITLNESLNDFQSLGNCMLEIARQYIAEEEYDVAEQYVNQVQKLAVSKQFNAIGTYLQLLMAKIEYGKQNYPLALSITQKAIDVAQGSKSSYYELQCYELLAAIHKNMDNYQEAFLAQDKLTSFKDSIYLLEKSFLIEDLETQYQVSKKEQEIELLNTNKVQQNLLIKVLGALVLMSLALFFIFFRWRRSTIKNHQIIEDKNKQLKSYIDQNLQLENFAYIASHDLKTPLRNIISFSQLLERKLINLDDPQIKSYIHFITNGSKELMSLTQDLLDYSTLNKNALQVNHFRIDSMINEMLQNIQSVITETNTLIDLKVADKWINADPIKLKQVFQNLILNAIKFHPPGKEPKVDIQMVEYRDNWEFIISDQGIGIDPEFHEKIFLLLKRLHTKDAYEGTGMGLAIAKRVIDQHGGRIWLDSAVGEGSSFHFTIPKYLRTV